MQEVLQDMLIWMIGYIVSATLLLVAVSILARRIRAPRQKFGEPAARERAAGS